MYGFRNRKGYSYDGYAIANATTLQHERAWEVLARAGKRVILLGVPQTHPPKPINGHVVSDFLTPSTKGQYTPPPELKDEVECVSGGYVLGVENFRTPDKEALVRRESMEKIAAITDPTAVTWARVAYRPQELYRALNGVPPDLIVYFGDLHWRSVGSVGLRSLYTFDNGTGPDEANHNRHGIFIMNEAGCRQGRVEPGYHQGLRGYDVAPTVLNLFGLSADPRAVGRSLTSIGCIVCLRSSMDIELSGKRRALTVIRHWLLNFSIAFFPTVILLVLIEVVFRAVLFYGDVKILNAFKNIGQESHLGDITKPVALRHMIRHSDNPRIIYELIPDISVQFMNKSVTINSHGFRGPDYNTVKGDKTIRIVGLGDSLMFGWGVSDDEHYFALVSQYLNQSSANGYKWEIINTAVPGYNTAMEVETLKARGLQYDPDLVIIGFIGNDLSLPNFIRKEENYLSLRKSFVVEYVLSQLGRRGKHLHDGFIDPPLNASGDDVEKDPSRVPAQYKDMVGPDAYRSAMAELRSLSLRHDFQVIAFTTYFPVFVEDILKGLDVPMLEAGDAFSAYMSEHGIKEYEGSPLTVSKQDPHPSALGHAILADVLYNHIKDSGVQSRILQRRGILSPAQ